MTFSGHRSSEAAYHHIVEDVVYIEFANSYMIYKLTGAKGIIGAAGVGKQTAFWIGKRSPLAKINVNKFHMALSALLG